MKNEAIELLKELLLNGSFFSSAIELEHKFDGEYFEQRALDIIEKEDVNFLNEYYKK